MPPTLTGVARWAAASHDAAELTTELGSTAGTVAYMAPEVLMGRPSDHRADLFSLGVVFYEMLTEHHPFHGPTATAIGDRILHETPAPTSSLNPRVQPELQAALDKMLAKDPKQRYATAEDLGVDLRAVRSGTTTSLVRPPPSLPHRLGWPIPAALAALLIVSAVVWWAGNTANRSASSSPTGTTTTAPFEASDWIIANLLQVIKHGYPRAEIRVDPIFSDLLDDPRLSLALDAGCRRRRWGYRRPGR